jgi:lipid-A-disaccharide synthase
MHNIAQGLLGARRHLHVFVVAGEPSGDVLGAALMTALRAQIRQGNSHRNCIIKPDCGVDEGLSAEESKIVREEGRQEVKFSGVGGPLMRAAGLQEVFGMEDLAVMGLWELIPHILRLYVRLQQARRAILHSRPDIGDTN